MSPSIAEFPELAGVATFGAASRIALSVDEDVARLMRFRWVERRVLAFFVAHLTSEPVWEVKCAFALHQWQSAEHVDALRRRIAEMRSPTPRLDTIPENDPTAGPLEAFLGQVDAARDTQELLAGVYGVLLPALAAAYRDHVARTNPLVDYPTRRLLRFAVIDIDEALSVRRRALR